jgi:hypothetical protein
MDIRSHNCRPADNQHRRTIFSSPDPLFAFCPAPSGLVSFLLASSLRVNYAECPETQWQHAEGCSQPQIDTDFHGWRKGNLSSSVSHPCESVAKIHSSICLARRGPRDKTADRRRIELEEIFVEAKIAESNRGPFSV